MSESDTISLSLNSSSNALKLKLQNLPDGKDGKDGATFIQATNEEDAIDLSGEDTYNVYWW